MGKKEDGERGTGKEKQRMRKEKHKKRVELKEEGKAGRRKGKRVKLCKRMKLEVDKYGVSTADGERMGGGRWEENADSEQVTLKN